MDLLVLRMDYDISTGRKVGVTKIRRTLYLFQGIWLYDSDSFKRAHPAPSGVR